MRSDFIRAMANSFSCFDSQRAISNRSVTVIKAVRVIPIMAISSMAKSIRQLWSPSDRGWFRLVWHFLSHSIPISLLSLEKIHGFGSISHCLNVEGIEESHPANGAGKWLCSEKRHRRWSSRIQYAGPKVEDTKFRNREIFERLRWETSNLT